MTQEIKDKLEQAAEKWYGNAPGTLSKNIFKHGAQTILENPVEWGLEAIDPAQVVLAEGYHRLQSENERLREALDRIANEDDEPLGDVGIVEAKWIAKEALKQEDATCPKCGYPLFKHLSKTCCQGCDYVKQQ